MAANGAAGTTLAEMLEVLGPGTTEELNGALNSMEQAISSRSGMRQGGFQREAEVTLRVANSLWGQQGLAFETAFLDGLAAYYGAGLHTVDYVAAAEAARTAINAWVDEQTAGKITELIGPGVLTRDSRLVLANAILLTAPWFEPFVKEATTTRPFTTASGQQVTTDMMSGTQTSGYARGSGWTAVDIPYLGGELAMTVVVPDAGGWQDFEAGLDGAALQAIFDGLARRKYVLTLPRWTSRTSAAMAPMLAAMGMPQAFSGAADFSAMTTEERLSISAVAHQAYIVVDEDGTEAAAATAVVMERTSAEAEPPPVVDVDRPFLYAIRDLPTSTVLFLGRVLDPTRGG
jgi:serpin B